VRKRSATFGDHRAGGIKQRRPRRICRPRDQHGVLRKAREIVDRTYDFDWLPDGPIRYYFQTKGQQDFLDASFDGDGDSLLFVQGMLNDAARAQLATELRRLRARLAALHEESIPTPWERKQGIGMLLAMRRWEPAGFRELRKLPARGE